MIIVIVTEREEKERERYEKKREGDTREERREKRRERRSRVYVENVLVCTFKTPVSFVTRAFLKYTRERFERTHGSVFGARQEETHTSPRHTTHSPTHKPTPHITTQLSTPHSNTQSTHTPHCTHTHTTHECLDHAHNRQPTVILRKFRRGEKVNAWICARRSTDHDHALDKNLDHL